MLITQLRHTMAGLKSRRERLLVWLAAYDQSYGLFTKLEAVQSRVCETNLELRAAIQIKMDEMSSYMRACESKMSTLEDECEIARDSFMPELLWILEKVGAVMGDMPDDASVEEQLPAYTPRS